MNKFLMGCGAIVALALGTPVLAADLPVKAPVLKAPPPIAYNWTGFYLGIEGGGGWGRARHTDSGGFDNGGYDVSGALIGGTVGYNWQVNHAVFGLEGDGSWASIKGSTPGNGTLLGICGGVPAICSSELQALGTVRARAGLAFDRFLPYVTGGLAVGSIHGHEGTGPGFGAFGDGTTTVAGWTVGAGIEAMLSSNWSAKVEYLHVDLGNHVIFNDTAPALPEHIKFTSEIVRLGLNYKLNWGGSAVSSRY